MAIEIFRDPDFEWLDMVQPTGLVVGKALLKELGLIADRQTQADSAEVDALLDQDDDKPAIRDPWAFASTVFGWDARYVPGAPGGDAVSDDLAVHLPEHGVTLRPDWALRELGPSDKPFQLLAMLSPAGVDLDRRGALEGWEATPHQRFERLLRESGVGAGVIIADKEIRLIYAPRGETSGWISFPIRPLATVAGRPLLGGLKLLLSRVRLFTDADDRRLPALLHRSRLEQAAVSTKLAEQVLGALYELLRGFDAADATRVRGLARAKPEHLYEGLLTVLLRLVFILYAEDRDLLPSRTDARAREIYENGYSVRGLFAKLVEDAALNPDTMDERRGGWGRLLALFRLIHAGHKTHFVQARGGKLFDPDAFPFLEGRDAKEDAASVLNISDGCLLRVLEGLMTLQGDKNSGRERLSYRTLDVEQIGSVYETVMGFTVEMTVGRSLAIKAGKNNKTPVFVTLDALVAKKGKDRIKFLREEAGRTLSAALAKSVEAAATVEDMAAAFDAIVDLRASPNKQVSSSDVPILQPTNERRRSGSHYTPRSLTGPIVKHALEPALAQLGPDATPEQVLALKVCDPAVGSGAFLVETCRALAIRLIDAWTRWPAAKPKIPADEDEELHARRLVAQRCLYGVDKNPLATDLARLSLWLATLARDHEFTFLDHALKSGDSLVGLTSAQIAAANWDEEKAGLPLFRQLVQDRIAEATKARAQIQAAADDTTRAIQEARHHALEGRLAPIRLLGDAIIAAFFGADKAKAREKKRSEVESVLTASLSGQWDKIKVIAESLHGLDHPISPFHWELEFPEVFSRANPGFDAMVGNPPFLGGKSISTNYGDSYSWWLEQIHRGGTRNADLVAHFFRRSYGLLRERGVVGLIATNTVRQGDTRASGLTLILQSGGAVLRATRRLKWPGEAAVVVSVVHITKGAAPAPVLDNRQVRRISAYLVEGDFDVSPKPLAANSRKAFQGSIVLGMGFTFDDDAAAKGKAASLDDMSKIVAPGSAAEQRVLPYLGGEELNSSPTQSHNRYIINVNDLSIEQVKSEFQDFFELLDKYVRPERQKEKNKKNGPMYYEWWRYWRERPELYRALLGLDCAFALSRVSSHLAISRVPSGMIFADSCVVFAFSNFAPFAVIQSRIHEIWARFFASTLEDRLRYTPSDCFRTFPFPKDFDADPMLEKAGEAYHAYRAQLMIDRGEGLTKIYNRFHARGGSAPDITRLRQLHADLDTAVFRAFGWDDLAGRAHPEFIEQDADEGKKPKTRFDWPSDFKDEVLARLIVLNAERAAAELAAGITALTEEDELSEEMDSD